MKELYQTFLLTLPQRSVKRMFVRRCYAQLLVWTEPNTHFATPQKLRASTAMKPRLAKKQSENRASIGKKCLALQEVSWWFAMFQALKFCIIIFSALTTETNVIYKPGFQFRYVCNVQNSWSILYPYLFH